MNLCKCCEREIPEWGGVFRKKRVWCDGCKIKACPTAFYKGKQSHCQREKEGVNVTSTHNEG